MQDDSQITDGNGKTTIQLNEFLGKQAMHIATKPLAEYFGVAVNTVKNASIMKSSVAIKGENGITSERLVCTRLS